MIVVAHSNILAQDQRQLEKMRPYAPLSTFLVAGLLRREGHAVAVFDATFSNGLDDFCACLDRLSPAVVLVMEDNFNFLTKMCTSVRRQTALGMIAAAAARGCKVAINGPDCADNPAPYLAAGADAVILGEGEMAALELVRAWQSGDGGNAVPGLVLPSLARTAPRPTLADLDSLPHPAWDLIDGGAYAGAWRAAHGAFSWSIATSRGCPYSCNWCAKPTFGKRYAARSPGDVAAEMAALRDTLAPDHIWFSDDILGLDGKWIAAFAWEVRVRGLDLPFTMQSRANLMTEANVAALALAGAREVWLGIESGSQTILDAMDKGTTIEAGALATRRLKAHGIRACWFIQLGYPSETWDEILLTRDFIRAEAPDEIGVSVAYPLPGTVFHDKVRASLGQKRNWQDTGDLAMLFQGTFDTAFYRKLRDLLHNEVTNRRPDDAAWDILAAQANDHRSPSPVRLAASN